MGAQLVLWLAAAQLALAQELCWDTKPGYNAVSQLVRTPKSEQRPQLFYFGETPGPDGCRAACEKEPSCAAFTWMGKGGKGGFFGGGGSKWALQCYGRAKQGGMVPSENRDMFSGAKVPCADLDEADRRMPIRGGAAQDAAMGQMGPSPNGAARASEGRAPANAAKGAEGEEHDLMDLLYGGKKKAADAAAGAATQARRQQGESMSLEELLRQAGEGGARGGAAAARGGAHPKVADAVAEAADDEEDLMSLLLGKKSKGGGGATREGGQQLGQHKTRQQQQQEALEAMLGGQLGGRREARGANDQGAFAATGARGKSAEEELLEQILGKQQRPAKAGAAGAAGEAGAAGKARQPQAPPKELSLEELLQQAAGASGGDDDELAALFRNGLGSAQPQAKAAAKPQVITLEELLGGGGGRMAPRLLPGQSQRAKLLTRVRPS